MNNRRGTKGKKNDSGIQNLNNNNNKIKSKNKKEFTIENDLVGKSNANVKSTKNIISNLLPIFSTNNKKMVLTEIGVVISVGDGVAKIIGLKNVRAGEYVIFTSNLTPLPVKGIALNLENEFVLVAIFGNERLIGEGNSVKRGYKLVNVPTGLQLLGRVIDPLGNKIDSGAALEINKKIINQLKLKRQVLLRAKPLMNLFRLE